MLLILCRKDNDFLVVDPGEQPPAGYCMTLTLPATKDALQYTYHWKQSGGTTTEIGRYAAARLIMTGAPEQPQKTRTRGRPRVTHRKRDDKARRAVLAKIQRRRDKAYWLEQRRSLWPTDEIHAKLNKLQNEIATLEAQL
jgi:hypothetical protein